MSASLPVALMEDVTYHDLEPVPAAPAAAADLTRLSSVPVEVTVELGRTRMTIGQTLDLTPGAIIPLGRPAGEPVDLLVNGRPIGRAEVVVVDDEFGVRVIEIVSPDLAADAA